MFLPSFFYSVIMKPIFIVLFCLIVTDDDIGSADSRYGGAENCVRHKISSKSITCFAANVVLSSLRYVARPGPRP